MALTLDISEAQLFIYSVLIERLQCAKTKLSKEDSEVTERDDPCPPRTPTTGILSLSTLDMLAHTKNRACKDILDLTYISVQLLYSICLSQLFCKLGGQNSFYFPYVFTNLCFLL